MAKQDSADIQYLKQDAIGKVIAQGLSKLYQQKPQKPIKYLADWLLTYSQNMKKAQTVKKQHEEKQNAAKTFQTTEAVKSQMAKKLLEKRASDKGVLDAFQDKLANHQYHLELLTEEFPEFLEKSKHFTGVYIGELNHPPKEVTEEDIEENAHLATDQPKLINYIGSSKSHKGLMIGKTLPLDKGVTAEAFQLSLEDAPPSQQKKTDPPQAQEKKKKYVYVPDVIKNQKVHYFKIPKLGAYIAIPLIFQSYLFEHMFDSALEQRKKFIEKQKAYHQEKTATLEQLTNQIAAAKQRLQTHQQKNEQQQVKAVQQQVADLQQKKQEKQNEHMEYTQPKFDTHKKQMVVCADTLGQDRQISQSQQEFLVYFVKKFKQEFEKNEQKQLKKDIELQIQYEQSLEKPIEQLQEQLEKEHEISEQTMKELTETHKEEKLIKYFADQILLNKLKEQLQRPQIKQALLSLSNYRVIKFPLIIQHLLYFLGYTKAQIDTPHTTHLNWKEVKKIFGQGTINKLLAYDWKGAKPEAVKNYAKVSHLQTIFDKYPEEQVFKYNVGLGVLLKLIKLILHLRQQDVQIRKANTEQLKKQREQKLAENEKIEQQKATALDQHKATIPPEEIDAFNEVEWLKQYETNHPLVEIPPQIVDDIDNDI